MRSTGIMAVAALLVMMSAMACSDDNNSSGLTSPDLNPSSGRVSIQLTDAPAAYDSVFITFDEVSVQGDSGWIIVSEETQTHELLSLSGGVTALLGEVSLEPGAYGQIRLKITNATVVINGVHYQLTVPSGSQSGLKVGNGFVVEEGTDLNLVLDFDAARSVVAAGASGQFILKPRIRMVEGEDSGTVEGGFAIPADSSIAGLTVYALSGVDTVSSCIVKFEEEDGRLEGEFKLSYLPQGSYEIVAVDSAGVEVYSFGTVSVSSDSELDLGIQSLSGLTIGDPEGEGTEQSMNGIAGEDYRFSGSGIYCLRNRMWGRV